MDTPLGKNSILPTSIDPSVLCPIERAAGRRALGLGTLPFTGVDTWTCWECSWLDSIGAPQIAIAELSYPCESEFLIESKSLKLFLAGFHNVKLSSAAEYAQIIKEHLGTVLKTDLHVEVFSVQDWAVKLERAALTGINLDHLNVASSAFAHQPELLRVGDAVVNEQLFTHAFRSLCPVTGQPDWATVAVRYHGAQINHPGLAQYLYSLRNHQGFHEQCCEMIFTDILQRCSPSSLSVQCLFTRRGGIDINPIRHTPGMATPQLTRVQRQ